MLRGEEKTILEQVKSSETWAKIHQAIIKESEDKLILNLFLVKEGVKTLISDKNESTKKVSFSF